MDLIQQLLSEYDFYASAFAVASLFFGMFKFAENHLNKEEKEKFRKALIKGEKSLSHTPHQNSDKRTFL